MTALPDYFWSKVDKDGPGGCWIWTAARVPTGYGNFGNPLGGRVRACVNPAHLEPVTHRENVLRGVSPTAINATKERCPQGHEYDYRYPDGRRGCKTCSNEQSRAYRARRKQRADAA